MDIYIRADNKDQNIEDALKAKITKNILDYNEYITDVIRLFIVTDKTSLKFISSILNESNKKFKVSVLLNLTKDFKQFSSIESYLKYKEFKVYKDIASVLTFINDYGEVSSSISHKLNNRRF